MIFHSGHVSCPAQLSLQQSGLDAGGVGSLENFDIGDMVTPVDVEDDAKAALVKPLQEADVATISDPGFGPIQKSGQHNCFVHAHFCVCLEVVVVPDSSAQPAKCTVGLCQPIIHFFVDSGIGGNDASQVAKLLDGLEEGAVNGDAWWLGGALGCGLMEDLCLFNADNKAKELTGSCKAGGKSLQGSLCVSNQRSVVCKQQLPNESLRGFGVCLESPKVEEAPNQCET